MLERFTEKSINAMIIAQDIVKSLGHDQLYPLHLFAGIASLKTGILARVLKVTKVDTDLLKEDVARILENKKTSNVPEIVPFSKEVKEVLDQSWNVAKKLGINYIGPEHIYFVLANDNEVQKIFEKHNIDINRITSTLTRIVEKKSTNLRHPEDTKSESEHYFSIPSLFNENEFVEIMNCALDKMKEKNLEALGTEQVLSAIIEKSNLNEFLSNQNIDTQKISQEIESFTDRKKEFVGKSIFCTPKLYNVMNKAYEYAKELGSTSLLPEHVMLGILSDKNNLAYDAIKKINPATETLFENIIKPIEKQKPTTFTILSLAKKECRRLGHEMLGTEMILLGTLEEGSGIGAIVLSELGVTLKDVRDQIEKILGYGSDYEENELYYTNRAKRLLEIAWREAKKSNKPRIESEHILLGIIKLRDCIAMKVLTNLGVDAVEIKQGIMSKNA